MLSKRLRTLSKRPRTLSKRLRTLSERPRTLRKQLRIGKGKPRSWPHDLGGRSCALKLLVKYYGSVA
jgi:hypothetical protein